MVNVIIYSIHGSYGILIHHIQIFGASDCPATLGNGQEGVHCEAPGGCFARKLSLGASQVVARQLCFLVDQSIYLPT